MDYAYRGKGGNSTITGGSRRVFADGITFRITYGIPEGLGCSRENENHSSENKNDSPEGLGYSQENENHSSENKNDSPEGLGYSRENKNHSPEY